MIADLPMEIDENVLWNGAVSTSRSPGVTERGERESTIPHDSVIYFAESHLKCSLV